MNKEIKSSGVIYASDGTFNWTSGRCHVLGNHTTSVASREAVKTISDAVFYAADGGHKSTRTEKVKVPSIHYHLRSALHPCLKIEN